jgi:hypothetical protein
MKKCEICKNETNDYYECFECETIICQNCVIYCEEFGNDYCCNECINCNECCYKLFCKNIKLIKQVDCL